ncbi:polysaccharide biosynthesis/export family protein [Pseudorhizobium endolithicum]|nr:polysaccharide biosynthesis/export family protein [Pseudorhizobium endolithicum]
MFAILSALSLESPALSSQEGQYKIAVGDVLTVTVYGDSGLTGTFPVGPDGTIGYPILGNVDVLGKSLEAVSDRIREDLSSHIANLAVAVAVKEYAPIFIVGDVQKPGRYEFRPGMIVLELFTLGGGLRETTALTDVSGLQLIQAQQDYEDMSLQLLSQEVRRARLMAELGGTEFSYSQAELGLGTDPNAVQKIIDSEMTLFRLRLARLEEEVRNLEAQKQHYVAEIETLEKSGVMRQEQFDLLSKDVDVSQELVTRGAASQAVLRERKRELLGMNQQLLEFGSFLARAQQNRNEIDRRILELRSTRKSEAANELTVIDLEIVRLRRKMAFSVQAMAEIGAAARRFSALDNLIKTEFSVVRQVNEEYKEFKVDEHTKIAAGDVVRVRLTLPAGTTGSPVPTGSARVGATD